MERLDYFQATLLALVQGLTEFLPISSSAHLLLPGHFLGWQDQGLAFDVAVHVGTLLAVILYFRKDLLHIATGWTLSLLGRAPDENATAQARLGWMLIIATLPVIIAGLLLRGIVDSYFRGAQVIVVTTVLFALVLWYADRKGSGKRSLEQLSLKGALLIGMAQVLALIPGTSRSGITMSAALLCQLSREDAGRFSFLLSIPVIGGAGLLLGLDLLQEGGADWLQLAYAALLSGVVAYLSIHFFLRLISRIGFMPFVIYRLLLGLVLLLMLLN